LRETGKFQQETKLIKEKLDEILIHKENANSQIQISQGRIEQFKTEMKLNQEELQQWMVITRQNEEDGLVIMRYSHEDESKIKAMLHEIEKASGIVEAKQKELEDEIIITRSLEIELDNTAEQFRNKHEERRKLLEQWEKTLSQMSLLNERIQNTIEHFEDRKKGFEKHDERVAEQKKNLEQAISNVTALERPITIDDHKDNQLNGYLSKDTQDLAEFADTVDTQRHMLDKLEGDERFHQAEIDDLREKTAKEAQKKEYYEGRLTDTQNALHLQKDIQAEITDQKLILSDLLRKDEAQTKVLDKEIEAVKKINFHITQDLHSSKKKKEDILA
jgi:hypothetical protein